MIKEVLLPKTKEWKSCKKLLQDIEVIQDTEYFYCSDCINLTTWYYNTFIGNMKITFSQFENLINCYIGNKSLKDAYDFLRYLGINERLNKNTVRRYFALFNEIALDI